MWKWTHCHHDVCLLLGFDDVDLKCEEAAVRNTSCFHTPPKKKIIPPEKLKSIQNGRWKTRIAYVVCFIQTGVRTRYSHLQNVIQGPWPKDPSCVEQSAARLLHLVLLPPWGLSVPRLRALQTLAAALKLLSDFLEPTHVSGTPDMERRGKFWEIVQLLFQ